MIKNIYNKFKKILIDSYKNIIFFLSLYIIFMWPINYYITVGGGIMKIGNRIVVEDSYESKGSFNLAYINQVKGTVATYLLSYVMPDWERTKTSDYTYNDEETISDIAFRGKIDLAVASDNAIKNAFLKAGKTYEVLENNIYVYYVSEQSKSNLKVGDKILAVGDTKIKSSDQFKNILKEYDINKTIPMLIKRNDKEKKIDAQLYKDDGRKKLGILAIETHKYKTSPKVKIKFKSGESGPSGGLMETLDIYNKITEKDLTKGLKIAGTGEIDHEGNVGTIGGVKYKLMGASKQKADVFLVPNGKNYKTCLKVAKKHNLKIKIIGVSTFEEAVEALENIK